MNTAPHKSAIQKDQDDYNAAKSGDLRQLMQFAAKKSGRSAIAIAKDFAQLQKSDRKINIVEYVRWKLYDDTRYTPEERAAFISNDLHWPIIHKCCDYTWNAAAEDKVLADTLMRSGGVPVPETLAVIDRSTRHYPGVEKLDNADAIKSMILAQGGTGMFGKVVGGMISFGAFEIEKADGTHVTCVGRDPMTYDAFLADLIGDQAYMIQKTQTNHPVFAAYCSALATVRMVNIVRNGRIDTLIAVLKVPQGNNIADAFWRPGNLACEIDVHTGTIKTIVRRDGPEMTFLDDHPAKPGFMGLQLPHWDKLREVNDLAARIFSPLRYQSCDIAITPDGPVMIELNYGGGFDLPQNASGRGMLTPDLRRFFEDCGYDFNASSKNTKKGLLGIFGGRN